jgi:ATP/maltotriose-dependent transcriptional regulator MalT
MRLAQGRQDAAVATLTRLLAETSEVLSRAMILPAHVEVMIATGDLLAAERSVVELTALAESRNIPFLRAMAGQATGSLLLARNEAAGALPPLRGALGCWHDLNNPYEIARTRRLIGLACRALADEEGAVTEFTAAQALFSRLGARTDLALLQELISPPPAAAAGGLTERELEVLRLVAAGRSNREIATQLVVSEHTARRHLQNIFAKLGVSSRSAATAYAYQHALI